MIYLFNSAFRPKYSKNILNTLYLPENFTNIYRYKKNQSNSSDRFNVPSELKNENIINQNATIIFVDRFGKNDSNQPSYIYHPIRRGKILNAVDIGVYLHVTVELQQLIYPQSIQNAQTIIKNSLTTKNCPQLKNNDPENIDDGFYILSHDEIFHNNLLESENAWIEIISGLKETKAFKGTNTHEYIFLRSTVNLVDHKIKTSKRKKNIFKMIAKSSVFLDIEYFYGPQTVDNRSEATIELKSSGNLNFFSKTLQAIVLSLKESNRLPKN